MKRFKNVRPGEGTRKESDVKKKNVELKMSNVNDEVKKEGRSIKKKWI